MPKVSVVIPVYNVEPYLRECLDSVINQTLRDIEIICVDDGSTDGCPRILDEYAASDSRIKVIHKPNGGAASARKAGARLACSEYIGFVDADDHIDSDMYEALLNSIGSCDLAASACYKDSSKIFDAIPPGRYQTDSEMEYIFSNMMRINLNGALGMTAYMVNKLFRADMAKAAFDKIDANIFLAEDADFSYRYISKCKSVCVTGLCKYHYRWREGSAVHSANRHYLKNISDLYVSLSRAFSGHSCEKVLMEQLQQYTLRLLIKAPRMMGFSPEARIAEYIFPFFNELSGARVALYAAGAVGQSYYLQMRKADADAPVIWVDKQYHIYQEQFPVKPVDSLDDVEYDCLIIAVEKEGTAHRIREELAARGIPEQKLLWKAPVSILL